MKKSFRVPGIFAFVALLAAFVWSSDQAALTPLNNAITVDFAPLEVAQPDIGTVVSTVDFATSVRYQASSGYRVLCELNNDPDIIIGSHGPPTLPEYCSTLNSYTAAGIATASATGRTPHIDRGAVFKEIAYNFDELGTNGIGVGRVYELHANYRAALNMDNYIGMPEPAPDVGRLAIANMRIISDGVGGNLHDAGAAEPIALSTVIIAGAGLSGG